MIYIYNHLIYCYLKYEHLCVVKQKLKCSFFHRKLRCLLRKGKSHLGNVTERRGNITVTYESFSKGVELQKNPRPCKAALTEFLTSQ